MGELKSWRRERGTESENGKLASRAWHSVRALRVITHFPSLSVPDTQARPCEKLFQPTLQIKVVFGSISLPERTAIFALIGRVIFFFSYTALTLPLLAALFAIT